MEGKLNGDGILQIFRRKSYRNQHCIYSNIASNTLYCCDSCSQFGEPQKGNNDLTILSLCKKELVFTEFTDER